MPDVETPTLTEIPQGELGTAAMLLPDTPWATTAAQACERRTARMWVDSRKRTQALAILVPGTPDEATPPAAYLFGSDAPPDALVAFAAGLPRPVELICDDDVGEALAAAVPEATVRDHSVHWFESLDAVARPTREGLRRLRLNDADAVEALQVPGLLRVLSSAKDVLMIGGAYGLFEEDRLVSAAFTVDLSVNYARVLPFTVEDRRREGLATAVAQRLISSHHEQGRMACMLVEDRDSRMEAFARTVGFEVAARMTSYLLDA